MKIMFCPSCGARLPEDVVRCPKCGAPLALASQAGDLGATVSMSPEELEAAMAAPVVEAPAPAAEEAASAPEVAEPAEVVEGEPVESIDPDGTVAMTPEQLEAAMAAPIDDIDEPFEPVDPEGTVAMPREAAAAAAAREAGQDLGETVPMSDVPSAEQEVAQPDQAAQTAEAVVPVTPQSAKKERKVRRKEEAKQAKEEEREERRRAPKGKLIALVVIILIVVCAIIGVGFYMDSLITSSDGSGATIAEAVQELFDPDATEEEETVAEDEEEEAEEAEETEVETDETVIYETLSSAYDELSSIDSQIGDIVDDFNGAYLDDDYSVRSERAATADELLESIQSARADVEALNVSEDSVNYDAWVDICQLYYDSEMRVQTLCDAWDVSLSYDDPSSHSSEITEPIVAAQSGGTSVYLTEFDELYPTVTLIDPEE